MTEEKVKEILYPIQHTLIVDKDPENKVELIKSFVSVLRSEGYNVSLINESDSYIDYYKLDTENAANILEKFQKEMMERLKELEVHEVSNVDKLPEPPKKRVIIIDNVQTYVSSSDYKSVDKIKSSISSIIRLGKAAGFTIVYIVNRATGSCINRDMLNNMPNRVLFGVPDDGDVWLTFEEEFAKTAENIKVNPRQGLMVNVKDHNQSLETFSY